MINYKRKHNQLATRPGFTMVELVLSMAFIGTLLILIAVITMHIIAIYQKGLSIRAINSTGRQLVDEFTRAIEAAPTKSILTDCSGYSDASSCRTDGAQRIIFQQNRLDGHTLTLNGGDGPNLTNETTITNPPLHGAFCTGRYSYIWNTGYVLDNSYGLAGYAARITYYNSTGNHTINGFRLARVVDQERSVCKGHLESNYNISSSHEYNLGNWSQENAPVEVLSKSEDNLALYDIQIFPPTQHPHTLHSFYSGTFILATIQGNVNIAATGDYCNVVPDDLSTDFSYCAINKFNFATRATGELNESEKTQTHTNLQAY